MTNSLILSEKYLGLLWLNWAKSQIQSTEINRVVVTTLYLLYKPDLWFRAGNDRGTLKVRKIWANMTSHCWSIIRRYSGCFLVNTREGDYRPIDSIYNSNSNISTAGHNLPSFFLLMSYPRDPLRSWQLLPIEQHDFLGLSVTLSIFYFILRWQVSDWKTENYILYCKVWKIVAASVEPDQYSSFLSIFNSTIEMQK